MLQHLLYSHFEECHSIAVSQNVATVGGSLGYQESVWRLL